jgi:hypothetical protein
MSIVSSRFAISLLATVAGLSACDATVDDGNIDDDTQPTEEVTDLEEARSKNLPWAIVRAGRQAVLDRYLRDNAGELNSFLYTPLGFAGVPSALLNNFSAAFPDIWGTPDQRFGPQGLFQNPFDATATLPAGLGRVVAPNGIEVTTLSCAGCHLGRVMGPNGTIIPLIGAPNTSFNQFRTAVEKTVSDPRYFTVFGNNALTAGFAQKVLGRRKLIDNTLGAVSYNPANPTYSNPPDLNAVDKPGYLDAIGVASASLIINEFTQTFAGPTPPTLEQVNAFRALAASVMPPKPSQVDIVSVWRQGARPRAQWDGTIANPIYRNLGASVGVIGDPTAIDYQNAATTAAFNQDLPPPPYPFDVNIAAAIAGKQLFDRHCASCHKDGNANIYSPTLTGTDPNRALTVTPAQRTRFIAVLRSACKDPVACDVPDTDIIRELNDTNRGYVAGPLDGIWARAPYLHNGSVPTLRALLVPATRPATFIRGSIRYDQANVGFLSDATAAADPQTHVFDTTEAGASNAGHSSLTMNGIDWSRSPRDLTNLLEYLKTL